MAGISGKAMAKAAAERHAFESFVERLGSRDLWTSIESRPAPEPDLLCHHVQEGSVAFELVRLVDEDIAIALAGRRGETVAFATEDPTERIICSKLHKRYSTTHPMELLVSWEPMLVTPDDLIVLTIRSLCDLHPHPFRRVWYAGEHACWYIWDSV